MILLVITDGRKQYIEQTIPSARENLIGPITRRVICDDSGDLDYQSWLEEAFPEFEIISHENRQGYARAIRSAWMWLDSASEGFIFHLEDDFLFSRPVNLCDLADLLLDRPHLAQVALRRQAWGREVEHGGFIETAPGWYTEKSDEKRSWVETTRNWTCNPCLYRSDLLQVEWPDELLSEVKFGQKLQQFGLPWGVDGADVRYGFWGSMAEGRDWVEHIGEVRFGVGY